MSSLRGGVCLLAALAMLAPSAGRAQVRMQFPPASPGSPPAEPLPGPTSGGAPMATFDGTIQAPPPNWDPFATPGTQSPTLFPQDPYLSGGMTMPPGSSLATMQRLLDEVRVEHVWMPGNGFEEFGLHDVEASATFAIPFLHNTQEPLLVTPGFAIHAWNGPKMTAAPISPDMPGEAFDAWLQGAWNPKITPWLSGELAMRVGVYSDFDQVKNESLRYTGKGMVLLCFSPSFKVKAGVWYLDRVNIKLLPAGGIIWEPNQDWRFNILFPDPKISRRLANYGNTQWWLYARGEYGGGSWTVTRLVNPGSVATFDEVDYNDMRVSLGVEFVNESSISGLLEVGLAFERELYYRRTPPGQFDLNSIVFLRGGLSY